MFENMVPCHKTGSMFMNIFLVIEYKVGVPNTTAIIKNGSEKRVVVLGFNMRETFTEIMFLQREGKTSFLKGCCLW